MSATLNAQQASYAILLDGKTVITVPDFDGARFAPTSARVPISKHDIIRGWHWDGARASYPLVVEGKTVVSIQSFDGTSFTDDARRVPISDSDIIRGWHWDGTTASYPVVADGKTEIVIQRFDGERFSQPAQRIPISNSDIIRGWHWDGATASYGVVVAGETQVTFQPFDGSSFGPDTERFPLFNRDGIKGWHWTGAPPVSASATGAELSQPAASRNANIVLLAFADARNDLAGLDDEASRITEALRGLRRNEVIRVQKEESATLDEIDWLLTDYPDQVAVFHYGGHASGSFLALEDGDAGARGLAELLGEQSNIRLVFLNGCATHAQVDRLRAQGVPAIIATHVPIADERAKTFAAKFYDKLASGQPLRGAFDSTVSLVKAKWDELAELQHRSLDEELDETDPPEVFPWYLWTSGSQSASWKILPKSPPVPDRELPAPLDLTIGTADSADEIRLTSRHTPGRPGVKIVLETDEYMWWKGLGIGTRDPDIEGEGEGLIGSEVTSSLRGDIRLYFWKAKAFGVHTKVGERTLDLTDWDEHELVFCWMKQ